MALIINEFEIVPPPPNGQEQATRTTPPEQQEQSESVLRPEDVSRIMRRFVQRRLRLYAD